MNKIGIMALALFAGSFAFGETYTWTGAAGDGEWTTAGNWAVGEAAAEAAPGEADTAVFAANTAATVNFGETLTLGTIDLTAKGMDVVFTATDGAAVTVKTLNLGADKSTATGRTKITFDGLTMTAKNSVALNPGTFVTLDNGAALTATTWTMYMVSMNVVEARTELHNGSSLTATSTTVEATMRVNGTSILVIDDSTVICKGAFDVDVGVSGAKGWGRVCFSGAHPLLKVSGEFYTTGKCNWAGNMYNCTCGADFYFTIPEGGFAEPPIQHTKSDVYFMHTKNTSLFNSRLQVTADSPALAASVPLTQTLVTVAKPMTGTAAKEKTLVECVPLDDPARGKIAMSEDKLSFVCDLHPSAGIVTVASAPFKFADIDYTPVVDLAEGGTYTFTAPEHPEISADVTCTGYVIYDVDPVTLKRTKSSDGTGTTCNYTHGTGRREIEWQWEVPEVTVDTTGDDLQAAIEAYSCAKINIATGTYTPSAGKGFVIKNAIWLNGVGESPEDVQLRVTTGTSAWHALIVSNELAKVTKVLVSNNGATGSGSNGGIRLWKGTIDGCVVTDCKICNGTGKRLQCRGGGIRMEGGTVRNTVVRNCDATRYFGGGISMLGEDSLVENCCISNCTAVYTSADDYGGGVYAAKGMIRNSLIVNCRASADGFGAYLGAATMENCTIAGCSSPSKTTGNGLAFGNARLMDYSTDVEGGSKYTTSAIGIVRNTVVYNCTRTDGSESDIGESASNASVVENCNSIPQKDPLKGNISTDPQFDENYGLGFSDCVDSAQKLPWMDWMPDLAGNARIQGAGPDMGCFERAVSEELECSFTFETLEGGIDSALVRFDSKVVGDTTGAVYTWTVTDRAGNVLATTNGADCASVDIAITNAAFCSFRLDVVNGAGKTDFQLQPDALTVYASRVYVNINGSDAQPYATETSGAHSLLDAKALLKDGGEMLIAPGEYELEGRFYCESGKSAVVRSLKGPDVTLIRTKSDAQDFKDSNGYRHPAFQLSSAGARLEGVTITGVSRGLIIEEAGAIVSNCVVTGIAGYARKYWGTGVGISAGTLTRSRVIDCSIDTVNGTVGGAGLYQTGGLVDSCSFEACRLTGKPQSDSSDGGAADGAVVRQLGGVLRNSLIANGSSGSMAAVYVNGTMENCTIVNNTNTCTQSESSDGKGGSPFPLYRVGLRVGASGKVLNTASSLNRNVVLGETNLYVEAGATVENCFTAGNARFKKPAKGDWRLKQNSPCVDAGQRLEWMTEGATDLNGEPRVRLSGPDIGCYECQTQGFIILIDGKGGRVRPTDDPPQEEPSGGGEKPDDSGQASTDPTTDPSQPGGGSGSSSEEPETPEEPETGIVIPHRGETVPTLARVEGLSDLEQSLYETTVAEFDAVNPINEATGRRKYISFGFLTDEHSCKRVEGDDAAKNPVKDYWYYAGETLTKCDHSIRLLGAVAGKVGLDAVFNGGDFSTGNSIVGLTDEEYLAQIAYVKSQFAQYLPTTPFFTVDGNHDRNYAAKTLNGYLIPGHQWNDAQWRTALELFNSDVSQNPDVQVTMHRDLAHPTVGSANPGTYVGNSYHVDCTRLMANGKPNVRFVCVSEYDSTPGNGTLLRMYDGFQFYDPVTQELIDPAKTPDNTLICIISHGNLGNPLGMAASAYMNAGSRKGASTQQAQLNSNLGQHKGLGFIGSAAGHAHQTLVKPIGDNWKSSCVQVKECYAAHNSTAAGGYRFSVFTVDTDRKLLYETRVVDGTATNYATEIDWSK